MTVFACLVYTYHALSWKTVCEFNTRMWIWIIPTSNYWCNEQFLNNFFSLCLSYSSNLKNPILVVFRAGYVTNSMPVALVAVIIWSPKTVWSEAAVCLFCCSATGADFSWSLNFKLANMALHFLERWSLWREITSNYSSHLLHRSEFVLLVFRARGLEERRQNSNLLINNKRKKADHLAY